MVVPRSLLSVVFLGVEALEWEVPLSRARLSRGSVVVLAVVFRS